MIKRNAALIVGLMLWTVPAMAQSNAQATQDHTNKPTCPAVQAEKSGFPPGATEAHGNPPSNVNGTPAPAGAPGSMNCPPQAMSKATDTGTKNAAGQ